MADHGRLRHVGLAASLLAGSVLLVAEPAQAQPNVVECGQTIAKNTILTNDIGPCLGNGLIIGADNITLDLAGHTIRGDRGDLGGEIGVDLNGHDGVTVRNGTIRSFFTHVQLGQPGAPVHNASVVGLRFFDGSFGTDGTANDSVIALNTSDPTGPPDTMLGGDLQIAGTANRVVANVVAATAIGVAGTENRVLLNRANNLGVGPGTGGGVVVSGNVVQTLTVYGGSGTREFPSTSVTHNLSVPRTSPHAFTQGGIIVWGGATGVLVANNRIATPRSQIEKPLNGITIIDGDINRVIDNLVSGAGGHGILVQGPVFAPPPFPPVPIAPGATNTLVQSNTTRRKSSDGIHNDAATTTLQGNVANDNANLGIASVAGATDGGGNRARRNGNPLQCTNVVC